MLHHVSVGVRDVEAAAPFYDAVLGALGYKRIMEFLPYGIGYGETHPTFWIQLPHNQQIATAGNGVHVAFAAPSQDAVHAFHAAALELGGVDAGAPGPRPEYTPDYYASFVIDLDGNKLEAVLLPPPAAPAKAAKKSVKKVPAKKAAPKAAKPAAKPVAKKAAKKAAKSAAKPVAKKPIAKKAAKPAKKAPAKKPVAKKPVAKKPIAKKTAKKAKRR